MQNNAIKSTYLGILVLHTAMLIGPAVMAGIFWFLLNQGAMEEAEGAFDSMKLIFQLIIVAVLCMAYVVNKLVLGKQLAVARELEDLEDKLHTYRSINIIRSAMLEGATLVSLVFFFVSGEEVFFYMSLIVLLFLLLIFPSQARITKELELNESEQRTFRKAMEA
ncbi:MAG: hypothetical protein AAF696_34775 [Bacteroidota bacterium]